MSWLDVTPLTCDMEVLGLSVVAYFEHLEQLPVLSRRCLKTYGGFCLFPLLGVIQKQLQTALVQVWYDAMIMCLATPRLAEIRGWAGI